MSVPIRQALRAGLAPRLAALLVPVLGSPLVTPLLRWTSEPCTHDGHLHYHRIAAMAHAWQSGLYLSRWLPDVAFGYGYPFFVFREALPLYLGLIPHLLGLPLPAALNLFYAFCVLAGGLFMFLWARDVFGPAAGLVSAVAYMAAPYVLIDALVRGNNPESLALALLPLLGWAGRQFMAGGGRQYFLLATLGLAVLALSHNISTLIFTPVYPFYLLVVGRIDRLSWRVAAQRLGLVVVLGLTLSAFYTLPALAELDQITISESVTRRNNDFHFNFASLDEILAAVSPEDPDLLNPPLPIRLGWGPAILALLGLVSAAVLRSREERGHILFMALLAAVFLFGSLSASVLLWERLPLVAFIQFPWRLVGRAALPAAFLAGAPVAAAQVLMAEGAVFHRLRHGPVLLAAGCAAVMLVEALPNLYPNYCPVEPFPTIAAVHAYERSSGLVGVDPAGSYFPKTVQVRPEGSPLEADYLAGRPPVRFDAAALPADTQLISAEYEPTSARMVVDGPTPFQARYLSFYYPGWTVTVDGQQVAVAADAPAGLLTFEVPAGRHEIEIRWRQTPLRAWAGLLSGLALAGVLAVVLVPGLRRTDSPGRPDRSPGKVIGLTRAELALLAAVGLAILGAKLLIVDRLETPLRRAGEAGATFPGGLQAAELRLDGYDLSRPSAPAGATFDIDLAWRTLSLPQADYQSNVWLQGPEGLIWSDKETERPRLYEATGPTGSWLPGKWAWDSREVRILPGTPPGLYDIVLTLFDLADLQPQTLVGADQTVRGPTAVIGQFEVTRPATPPELSPQYHSGAAVGGLTLLGYSQDRQETAPGDHVLLSLFWEKAADATAGKSLMALNLTGADGQTAAEWSLPPVREAYPPDEWLAGERLLGQHVVRLPAGLSSGRYHFILEGVQLADLAVEAPERRFSTPPLDVSLNVDFDGQARLLGYTISPSPPEPGAPLTLTLAWQGLAEMERSYRVFVHLLDGQGAIVDQSDGEPAAWQRPTTGWLPGEVIVDTHTLAWPADLAFGQASLRAGLYELATGDRLPTEGGDAAHLPLPAGP